MTTASQIKFSKIKNRLDAEFFKPEYVEIESVIERLTKNKNFSVVPFRSIAKKIRKGIFSILKTEYREEGVPFIRVGNIKNLIIDEQDIVFISEEKNASEIKTCLHPRDIVISKGGTIGEVAIIPQKMSKVNISQDVIGISIYEKKVLPEYVAVYLSSKFGKTWFVRNRSQQTHPHLTLEPTRELLIPIPLREHQLKVSSMINNALNLLDEANRDYTKANDMFLNLIGLGKNIPDEQIQTINYSNLLKYDRLDTEFFKSKHIHINKILEEKEREGHVKLKKLYELGKILKGIEVGSKAYLNQGNYMFLRVSNISKFGVKIENSTKYIRRHLYYQLAHKYQPQNKDILYSKDGTIGISLIVESDFPSCIICSGIIRIRPRRNIDPYYLSFVLNSLVCQSQAKRYAIGTVIKHLPTKALKKLIIPFIPSDKQGEISKIVQNSFNKRRKGKLLIKNSVLYVEELLERSSLDVVESEIL